MTTTKITQTALTNLTQELNTLLNTTKYEAIQQLKDARELGDLSENAEYQAAQEYLFSVNNRIQELQRTVNNAEIIEITGIHTYVTLGATITLRTTENGKEEIETFTFVDKAEMDPFEHKLSTDCALFKAIKDKQIGFMMKFITDRPHFIEIIDIA